MTFIRISLTPNYDTFRHTFHPVSCPSITLLSYTLEKSHSHFSGKFKVSNGPKDDLCRHRENIQTREYRQSHPGPYSPIHGHPLHRVLVYLLISLFLSDLHSMLSSISDAQKKTFSSITSPGADRQFGAVEDQKYKKFIVTKT